MPPHETHTFPHAPNLQSRKVCLSRISSPAKLYQQLEFPLHYLYTSRMSRHGASTLREVSPSSSSVRVICVAWASSEFSTSSLIVVGMSRIGWPLERRSIVVLESLIIILESKRRVEIASETKRVGW